jgi:HEAT repeat protein
MRLLFVVVCVTSCAGGPALRAAETGDRASLGAAIRAREKAGTLTNDEAASLARAVADRDVRSSPPAEATERVRDVRPCARELDDALAARMKMRDEAAPAAALARIDGRGLSVDDVRSFFADPDARWRPVGARSLVRPEDRAGRLKALLDPDPLVRRQAARACHDAAVADDLGALAETARLDPEPMVRTEAVRALAALPVGPASPIANVLRDLWSSGDDGIREDIALAWSMPSVWSAGGREALRVAVASGHGAGVVEAAAAVLRHREAGDEEIRTAVGQLARAIEGGARSTRLQALGEAPLDRDDLRAAVQRATTDDDLEVRVAALARLAEEPGRGGSAPPAAGSDALRSQEALEALAQPGSPVASRARFALANARDRHVQSWLEDDLTAAEPEVRLAAASALAALGVAARAAPLLADADPSVRVRSACTIVLAARFPR